MARRDGLAMGKLLADLRIAGESMPIKNSVIAATALVHGLTVVSRNTRDFMKAKAKAINPFAIDID